MTMHLEKPYLNMNRHVGKKPSFNSAKLAKAKREHEEWLRSRGLAPDQLERKLPRDKAGRRLGVAEVPDLKTRSNASLSNQVDGPGYAKPKMTYTGTEIVGIGVMHKSNAVPILRGTTQAQEISSMRR